MIGKGEAYRKVYDLMIDASAAAGDEYTVERKCGRHTCGTKTRFGKISKNARAVDLPHEGFGSYFLDVFDRPPRSSPCECARSSGASLSSVLHLANSQEIEDKIGHGDGRVARLMKDKADVPKAIEELYLAAYSRPPTAAETKRGLAHVESQKDVRSGLEDLLWAILNTREFLFNH